MNRLLVIVLGGLVVAACADTPVQSAAEPAPAVKTAKVCDDEPVTGSRIRRCDRTPENVEVISREQFERMTTRSGLIPLNPTPGGR